MSAVNIFRRGTFSLLIGAIRVTVAETADSVRRFLEDFRFGPTVVQQSVTYEVKLLEQIEIKVGQIFVQLKSTHKKKDTKKKWQQLQNQT